MSHLLQVCHLYQQFPARNLLGHHGNISITHPNILSLTRISNYIENFFLDGGVPRECTANITSCSTYRETNLRMLLRDYYVDENYKKCILLQMVHALSFLRNYDSLTAENICFSTDSLFAVLIDRENSQCGHDGNERDKETLQNFFAALFPEGYSDAIAVNFWRKLSQDYRNPRALLKHPFFWDDKKKLNFLFDSFESIKAANMYNQFNDNVQIYSWYDRLMLQNWEVVDYERQQQPPGIVPDILAIANFASHGHGFTCRFIERQSNKASFLLGFIRNCLGHFSQDPVMRYFFSDARKMWNFFNQRFPDLLMQTHKFVFDRNLFANTSLQSEYFETECPFSFLPRRRFGRY